MARAAAAAVVDLLEAARVAYCEEVDPSAKECKVLDERDVVAAVEWRRARRSDPEACKLCHTAGLRWWHGVCRLVGCRKGV
jgi:nitrate/TMAO reductase-like tetraheme cytochrome c subunit